MKFRRQRLSYTFHTKSQFVKWFGRLNTGLETEALKYGHEHTVMHSVDAFSAEPHKSVCGTWNVEGTDEKNQL
jgi:hypothetical protein